MWPRPLCSVYLLWLKVWILTRWCLYFCRIFLVSSSVLKEFMSTSGTSASNAVFRCWKQTSTAGLRSDGAPEDAGRSSPQPSVSLPRSAAPSGPGRCSRCGRWSSSWGPYIPCWYPGLHLASPPPVCLGCQPRCLEGHGRRSYRRVGSGGEGERSSRRVKETVGVHTKCCHNQQLYYSCEFTPKALLLSWWLTTKKPPMNHQWQFFISLFYFFPDLTSHCKQVQIVLPMQLHRDCNSFECGLINYQPSDITGWSTWKCHKLFNCSAATKCFIKTGKGMLHTSHILWLVFKRMVRLKAIMMT